MESVAVLRKAPASADWPTAVLEAAEHALSSGTLTGPDLGRVMASLPVWSHWQVSPVSAATAAEPAHMTEQQPAASHAELPASAPAPVSSAAPPPSTPAAAGAAAAAAAAAGAAAESLAAAEAELGITEAPTAGTQLDGVHPPPAVLKVSTLLWS